MNQITGIGRPLDPRIRTNLIIGVIMAIFTILGTVYQMLSGASLLSSTWWGIQVGLSIFFCWAIARELDPDHDLSAFVGLPLTILGFWYFGPPSILFGFWFLILSRILNRTMGLSPTIIDSLILVGLASWLTLSGNWIFGLVTALGFYLDSQLSPRLSRQTLFATATFLITLVLFAFNRGAFGIFQVSTQLFLGVLGVFILFAPVIYTSRQLDSVGDETGEPLNPRRIQAAQILGLVTCLQIALWSGGPGVLALTHFWGAVIGIALFRLYILLFQPQSV